MKAGIWMAVVLMGALGMAGKSAATESNAPQVSPSLGSLVAATATDTQGQYDVAYSMCQVVIPADSDVDFLNVVNAIFPTNASWKYFYDRSIRIEASDSLKVTLIDAPKHGVLEHGHVYGAYLYKPNKDYFGSDRMIFSVEVKGKVFKVIYSVDVVEDPDRGSPSCPSSPSINELPTPAEGRNKHGSLDIWVGPMGSDSTTPPSPQPSGETPSHSTRRQSRQVAGYPASGRGGNRERQS